MISQFLLFSGIVLGLLGAAKIPQDTVSLNLFVLGSLLSIIGVWQLHRQARQARQAKQHQEPLDVNKARRLFAHLNQDLSLLQQQLEGHEPDTAKILQAINHLNNQYLMPLLCLQAQVTQQVGHNAAADIYLAVAQSERLLNRMRTALGDGYPLETEQVFPYMSAALQVARKCWQQHLLNND